jgi:hypothetical protein
MRCVFPYFKNDSFHIQIQHVVVFATKWLEKPECKCLSQIQNKFKAAACNVCIKDINISNIGGRVHLKVTFSQQNTEHILKKKQFETVWVG